MKQHLDQSLVTLVPSHQIDSYILMFPTYLGVFLQCHDSNLTLLQYHAISY